MEKRGKRGVYYKYAIVFMVFTLGAVGLPGTSGFIGEFLILISALVIFESNLYKGPELLATQ